MKSKSLFNQRKALRFRQFKRKGYALFACLGRVVTIGVLSVATLQSATAAHRHVSTDVETSDTLRLADKELTLDEVEVTGSRAPLALGQAARMVTVLSRDDIQAAPVQSINDLLKLAVGIDVRQRGPIGAQTDIGIRGSTQEQITILLNGINICDPQTGHNTFDLPCDISDIVRIEVLEGPAARIYGTSSLVGAINIVTTDRGERSEVIGERSAVGGERSAVRGHRHVEARLESGSFGYLSAAARFSLIPQPSSLNHHPSSLNPHPSPLTSSISASYTRSDGYSRAKSGALNADYEGFKAFWNSQFSMLHAQFSCHAGITAKGFGSNTFYSAKFDEQYERTMKVYAALQGEVSAGGLHFRPAVYWNRSYDRFELIRGSEEKVKFNRHRTDVFGINLNSWFDWLLGRTALGAEFRNEDIVSGNLGEPLHAPHGNYRYGLNRSNLSFHLEHNILLSRFTLSAGVIAVKNTWNEMPFTLYPGVDASLRLGNHWKIYASYNTSLRMPSSTELYYSVGGHKADKYLKPGELQAVEGGIKFHTPTVTAQASVFHHHQRNTIDWVMDTRETEPVWQSVNFTKINTLGQEITLSVHGSRFKVQGSYCHLHQQKDVPEYLQSQYSLEYLRHKLTAGVRLSLTERLLLSLNYRWQDRRGTYTDTQGRKCDYHPYAVVDARLAWHGDAVECYIEGNNLTSHRYVDYGNVPQAGCWMVVGTKFWW